MIFNGLFANIFKTIFSTVGLTSPILRFVGVAAILTGAEFVFKPRYAFTESGSMRAWAIPFTSPSKDAVYTPVGFFPILIGSMAALFV